MNSTTVKQFHDDLRASVIANVPVEISDTPSLLGSPLSLKAIEKLERQFSDATGDATGPLSSGEQDSRESQGSRYRSAMLAYEKIGLMPPILEGLSAGRYAVREVSKILRRTLWYVALVLAVACAGLMMFANYGVPALVDMRADLVLPASVQGEPQLDLLPWIPIVSWLILIVVILLLLWMCIGGGTRIAMLLGGRRYVNNRQTSSAVRLAWHLIGQGVPTDEAMEIGCDVAAVGKRARSKLLAEVTELNGVTVGELSNSEVANSNEKYFETWAHYLDVSGRQYLSRLKLFAPTVILALLGGVIVLLYCVLIFWPMVTLVRDLTTLENR